MSPQPYSDILRSRTEIVKIEKGLNTSFILNIDTTSKILCIINKVFSSLFFGRANTREKCELRGGVDWIGFPTVWELYCAKRIDTHKMSDLLQELSTFFLLSLHMDVLKLSQSAGDHEGTKISPQL